MKAPALLLLCLAPLAPASAQQPPRPARPAPRPPVVWTPAAPAVPPLLERQLPVELPLTVEVPLALQGLPSIEVPLQVEPLAPLAFDYDDDLFTVADGPLGEPGDWVSSEVGAWNGAFGHRVPAFARPEPNDSLYRMAREALNRGEYRRAAELFQRFQEANPGSRYMAASMYWRAFALYRAGREEDLRSAIQVLDEQRRRYPSAGEDADVRVLVTRVTGALAARGDAEAVRRLREGAAQADQSCDREDMEVRAEALSALAGTDPASVAAVVKRVLADRSECAVPLRRRAVYLLGQSGDAGAADALLDAAQSDPSAAVRSDAIMRLAQLPGDRQVAVLTRLLAGSSDESTQLAVVAGLRRVDDPAARRELQRLIERDDLSERVRVEAVRSLARSGWGQLRFNLAGPGVTNVARGSDGRGLSESDAAFLRAVYGKAQSRSLKLAIVETLARGGGDGADQWLMGIARDPSEDARFRSVALSRLRRSDIAIADLAKLYDTFTERELRATMVTILGSRPEPEATDKLLDIARHDTDPSIRRLAISALARKNDPRTTKLLLELVEH